LTLSIGLASFPDGGPDSAALFERADQRLQEAKRQGRHPQRTVSTVRLAVSL
jgi:GGDEF domain-containing protein